MTKQRIRKFPKRVNTSLLKFLLKLSLNPSIIVRKFNVKQTAIDSFEDG